VYKLILDKRGVDYGNDDLPKLYKKGMGELAHPRIRWPTALRAARPRT
jgi:hypothetical protein